MKGRMVVLDTRSEWIYIGLYDGEDGAYIFLEEADAFDVSETSLSKNEYIRMVKQDGVVPARKRVSVLKNTVVAITFMDDILAE